MASDLTYSNTAVKLGLSNEPVLQEHLSNMTLMGKFLSALPFFVQVNSGYRAPAVNTAVGGSSTSQHMTGLGADIEVPTFGVDNKDLATYFWYYRDKMPELDQVIWYTGKSHVHVGICPGGARGCVNGAPRGQFLVDNYGTTAAWTPSQADLSSYGAQGLIALGAPSFTKKVLLIAGASALAVGGLAALWWWTQR